MAGSVGCGGPAEILFSPAGAVPLFPRACGGEAKMLEEGVGDHGHQRMATQTSPRAAFEVVEAEFFLELLVSLLADPARLDRRGECLEICVGRQVGEIVFLLAGRAPLADEPDLFARHMLHPLVAD